MNKQTIKKALLPIILIAVSLVVLRKCSFHPLPKKKLSFAKLEIAESFEDNEYRLSLKNPVACPMRFMLSSTDPEVNGILKKRSPILLEASADTVVRIADKGDLKGKIKIGIRWGNPELPIRSTNIASLPFPEGKSYELLQGNNSNPTHNSTLSRYAFDFTMKIGDTITSSQEGYVVTAIDGYKGWGYSDKWKSFGNQVMIYDTTSRLFTMYGHIKHEGSLVELGQYVQLGQPIAISGQTGQASEEHLHFNVFQADNGKNGGLRSYALDSIGKYKVKELKRYQLMTNQKE